MVKRLAVGEKPKSIAKDVGLSHSQVYRFASREDIKTLIEQGQMKLLEALPDAVKNMGSLVEGMEKAKDTQETRLCYEVTKVVLQAAGIFPSPTQSTFVQQVYKQPSNPFLDPVIQKLIDVHLKTMMFDPEELEAMKGKEGSGDR